MGHEGMRYPLASRELIADSIETMAMAHMLDALSLSEDQIVKQTARIFGFKRTGTRIRNCLEKVIREMISDGTLVSIEGRICIDQDRSK